MKIRDSRVTLRERAYISSGFQRTYSILSTLLVTPVRAAMPIFDPIYSDIHQLSVLKYLTSCKMASRM